MKKLLSYCLILLSFTAFAQKKPHPRPDFEKVKAAKIGMITERLQLSEKQAEKFWPIYNEFDDKRRENFMAMRRLMHQSKDEGITNDQKNELLNQTMELRENQVKIEKEYKDKFLKVISTQQFFDLLDTEKEFHRMIIEKARH